MILVTGANGQLGTSLETLLGVHGRYLSRSDLDITDFDNVRRLLDELRPDALINCAAYNAVDMAESDLESARAVNTLAVGALARATHDFGIQFVTFSTDYVFDGRSTVPYLETDWAEPISSYGASKLAGERAALAANPNALVIRTSRIISSTHSNFATVVLRRALAGQMTVVDDQVSCFTVSDDLARGTLAAIQNQARGILHMASPVGQSWYEFALDVVALAGIEPGRIDPCPASEYPTPAQRPTYSVLGSERLSEFSLSALPSRHNGLEAIVASAIADIGTQPG